MNKGLLIVLAVFFTLLLVGVSQIVAGPPECPDDQECRSWHKFKGNGECMPGELPVQAERCLPH